MDLYSEDESKTLCYNWQRLAEAVVARACVDYEMLHHPESGRAYIQKWRENNKCGVASWIELQKRDLEYAFGNGLGELAEAVGKRHLISKVVNQTADDGNIRKLVKRRKLRICKR